MKAAPYGRGFLIHLAEDRFDLAPGHVVHSLVFRPLTGRWTAYLVGRRAVRTSPVRMPPDTFAKVKQAIVSAIYWAPREHDDAGRQVAVVNDRTLVFTPAKNDFDEIDTVSCRFAKWGDHEWVGLNAKADAIIWALGFWGS